MTQKTGITRLHALIEGHVQGVGFRYYVLERASELELTGWARNTYEGDVEVTADGSRDHLEKLLTYLKQSPHSAYVIQVNCTWTDAVLGEFVDFAIRF